MGTTRSTDKAKAKTAIYLAQVNTAGLSAGTHYEIDLPPDARSQRLIDAQYLTHVKDADVDEADVESLPSQDQSPPPAP